MKNIKIISILLTFIFITYYGIVPYANSELFPYKGPVDFDFASNDKREHIIKLKDIKNELENIKKEENFANKEIKIKNAKKEINNFKKTVIFWGNVNTIKDLEGNKAKGLKQIKLNCMACHSIKKLNIKSELDRKTANETYGIVPPDLSNAGYLYSKKFLIGFILNPTFTGKTSHKFGIEKVHPMPNFNFLKQQDISDITALFKAISPKSLSGKEIYIDACLRCHSIKYADMRNNTMQAYSTEKNIIKYMDSIPPDLSQSIKSKSKWYLSSLINNPQKEIPGTSMPRVGLDRNAQNKVIKYLEEVGDSKKLERESTGILVLLYFLIFSAFAWLWKEKIERDEIEF